MILHVLFQANCKSSSDSDMRLSHKQSVVLGQHGITFKDKFLKTDFSLNFEEFKNFNDVLQIHSLANLKTVPLGEGVWFCLATLTFYSFKSSAYFRFLHGSWQKYIKGTHERVLFFIQHAMCESNQLNAIDKTG